MYTHIGLGIIALAAIMVIPISENSVDESKMYGYITLAVHDVTGNTLFEQIIHNQLVDTGENFMLGQAFNNGTTVTADANLIDAICVSIDGSFTANLNDQLDIASFNSNAAPTDLNCKARADTGAGVAVTILNDVATINTLTFNATGTPKNIAAAATITGIGICSNEGDEANDAFANCPTSVAPLLAAVDTADVTLGTDDTVDITYSLKLE